MRSLSLSLLLLWAPTFLTPLLCLAQEDPIQKAKAALAEVQKLQSGPSPSSPQAFEATLQRIDQSLGSVEQGPLFQTPEGLKLVVELNSFQVKSLSLRRRTADARAIAEQLLAQLQQSQGVGEDDLAMAKAEALLLYQDLSFQDNQWTQLDNTITSLLRCNDTLSRTPAGSKMLGAVGCQLIRYLSMNERPDEAIEQAQQMIQRIEKNQLLASDQKGVLVGRLVGQVLDFHASSRTKEQLQVWLDQANAAWRGLRVQSDGEARIIASQLIGHRAVLVAGSDENAAVWREYQQWLRRDGFAIFENPSVAQSYIAASIRALNQAEKEMFGPQLLRTNLFLDEFMEGSPKSQKPAGPGMPSRQQSGEFLRSQLQQGIASRMALLRRPALDRVAPELLFRVVKTGKAGSLSQLKGKVVVVEFWNPRCGSCLANFEKLSAFHEAERSKGLVLLGCTYRAEDAWDDEAGELNDEQWLEKLRDFTAKHKVSYPLVLANDAQVVQDFGIKAMPTFVLLDRQGKTVAYAEGIEEFSSDTFQQEISKALK